MQCFDRNLLTIAMVALTSWLGPAAAVSAQQTAASDDPPAEYRAGKSFISTPVFSLEEDLQLLRLFAGLRVADVSDAMDRMGLQDVGLVSPEVKPLWRDTEHFSHRIVGIAVTARYVPTNRPPAGNRSEEQFDRWAGEWYRDLSPEPFVPLLRAGSVLVIEDHSGADVGTIGSNNILGWKSRGCVGVVTNATARDTDEIIAERVPLYYKGPGRGIRPGRNQIESVNRPVVIGGVLVVPGDVVVADGDGVIVVPRRCARAVAQYAQEVLKGDKAGRRKKYEQLGIPLDDSVR